LDQFTTETLRDFLDEHWGEAAPATRRNRLAIVKSFLRLCVEERSLEANPAERIKPPKRSSVERQAYAPDVIEELRKAQPTLREQIAVQLLGRLALRKNELRLTEYLLHPKADAERPLDSASLHRWFKRALKRAGFPRR